MNIDYHALLPINGKRFQISAASYVAQVLNIPGRRQDSTTICYSLRFDGPSERLLNLWVAQETLMLTANATTRVFAGVERWLSGNEGLTYRPDRFFDETSNSLKP